MKGVRLEMKYFSFLINKLIIYIIVFFTLIYNNPAYSTELITGIEIKKQISSYLKKNNIESKPLLNSERLFRKCKNDIQIKPLFKSSSTLKVYCPDEDGWKLAVRTKTKEIKITNRQRFQSKKTNNTKKIKNGFIKFNNKIEDIPISYVTLNKSLNKGDIINKEDLKLIKLNELKATDYFSNQSDVIGRKLKQSLGINKIVKARHLEIKWDIKKGEEVIILSYLGPVQVNAKGKSLMNAQIGETARILNIKSGREIEGIVGPNKKINIFSKNYIN